MRKLITISVLSLALAPALRAQQSKFSCRIDLSVTSSEESKNEIKSYFNREFRALGDVLLTGKDPMFRVSVVAMEVKLKSGTHAGYTLSVVVEKLPTDYFVNQVVAANQRDKKFWIDYATSMGEVVAHMLRTTDQDGLHGMIKEIVADIDSEQIEKERSWWQLEREMEKEERNKSAGKRPVKKS